MIALSLLTLIVRTAHVVRIAAVVRVADRFRLGRTPLAFLSSPELTIPLGKYRALAFARQSRHIGAKILTRNGLVTQRTYWASYLLGCKPNSATR